MMNSQNACELRSMANREVWADQTASEEIQKQSDLGLRCLSRPFGRQQAF